MAIKNWHIGKIVLCWVAGLFMMFLGFAFLSQPASDALDTGFGMALLMLIGATTFVGLPIFLFVVTWKWLSGREKTGPSASQ